MDIKKANAEELMISICGVAGNSCKSLGSSHSILNGINPEYSLEGPKLKLQYFGHLMQISNLLEKTLMLKKIEGRRRRGRQRMR